MAHPRPLDEHPHDPVTDDMWSESWGFDFSADDGIAGFVRLRSWPQRNVVWWWAYLVGPELGVIAVRDHEVALPRQPEVLEIRADGLWGELVCETELEHWGIGMEAFGVRLDEMPALTAAGDEIGERIAVGLDLEWEVVSPAGSRTGGDGYSQSGGVYGDLLVGSDRITFDGLGVRDHSWGVGALTPRRRVTAMFGEDLALDVGVDEHRHPSGWIWEFGGEPVSIDAVLAEEHCDAKGVPVAGRWVIAHQLELELDVGSVVSIAEAGLLRAPCVVTSTDGRHGAAWWESIS